MELINAGIAIMVLVGGFLCARAYIPHVNLIGSRPADYLSRGLVLSALACGPRSFYWDVMTHISHPYLTVFREAVGGISINIVFNGLLLIGIYQMLRARYLTVPDEDRRKYNIFTAVFYPTGMLPRLSYKKPE